MHSQPLHDVLQEDNENLEFSQGVYFESIDSIKTTVQSTCYLLLIHMKKIAIQKFLLILLPEKVTRSDFSLH